MDETKNVSGEASQASSGAPQGDELDQILAAVSEPASQGPEETRTESEPADRVKLPDGSVVSREELIKGYMRQADYTRKTQALSEKAKMAEAYQGLMKWFAQHPEEARWLRQRLAGESESSGETAPQVSPEEIREERRNLLVEFLEIEEDLHGKKLSRDERQAIAAVALELQNQLDYEVPLKVAYEVWRGRIAQKAAAEAERAGYQKASQAKRAAVLPPAQGGEVPKPPKPVTQMTDSEWREALAREIDRLMTS